MGMYIPRWIRRILLEGGERSPGGLGSSMYGSIYY